MELLRGRQRAMLRWSRRVAVRRGEVVQFDDVRSGLVSGRPHVRIRCGAVVQPWEVPPAGAAEHHAEIVHLHAGHMFDQAEQVGAGWRQWPADVVFTQAIQLAEQAVTPDPEVVVKGLFFIHDGTLPNCNGSSGLRSGSWTAYCPAQGSKVDGRAATVRYTRHIGRVPPCDEPPGGASLSTGSRISPGFTEGR